MQKAVDAIDSGTTIFERKKEKGDLTKLRYICIDEFQDFSLLFMRLIAAIRKKNKNIEFFCVGDDWQAINGFAGSDLTFFENFSDYFKPSSKLNITGNYRSHESIVNIGNKIMEDLEGKPAIAKNSNEGRTSLVELDLFKQTIFSFFLAHLTLICLLLILS